MRLKIFDPEFNERAANRNDFTDDFVGRFRSGHQVGGRPESLTEWRVTTGDPDVAEWIKDTYKGKDISEWDATGEDNLEVFTDVSVIKIITQAEGLEQAMVLRNRNGQVVRVSDGEVITYPEDQAGSPDPQAGQTFAERKQAARDGMGAVPEVKLTFRLADNPDLGLFQFRSSSWGFVSDLEYQNVWDELADYENVLCTLSLKEVSFVAKSGEMKGKTVTYTKPALAVIGDADNA